jgi:glycosyltransferase involved in cell wall biosynthesis
MPFFSVIIPVHNRRRMCRRAIDSALAQSFTDIEIIGVDDGSTDDTPLLAEDYGKRIRYLRQENRGVSAARNLGIISGDSAHLAFLDSDDQWMSGKLERQARFIRENPGIPLHQTEEIWIRNGVRVNPMNRHRKMSGRIFIPSLDLCLISPSAVVMNRSLFETYGLFDETMPACEDYDMWLRITAFEQAGLIDQGLILKYGGHDDQLSHRYWGMDRFRLYSIIRLLARKKTDLKKEYLEAAQKSAMNRCALLINGANKRNNASFAGAVEKILSQLSDEDYSSIDCRSLL